MFLLILLLLLLIGTIMLFPLTPSTDGNAFGIILLEGAGCICNPVVEPCAGPILLLLLPLTLPPTLTLLPPCSPGLILLLLLLGMLLLDAPPAPSPCPCAGPSPCPLFAGLFSVAPPLASKAGKHEIN